MSAAIEVDHTWTDSDGEPLGGWVEIGYDEWAEIVGRSGGLPVLAVFSTLTDRDGRYGPRQVYTAWGERDSAHPLVDIRDLYDAEGVPVERSIFRRFVAAVAEPEGGGQ